MNRKVALHLNKYVFWFENFKACEAPASQNENSHYVCDDNGDIKCLPGWTGDLCDVPICRKGCDPQQGYCKRPGECRCKLGKICYFTFLIEGNPGQTYSSVRGKENKNLKKISQIKMSYIGGRYR